MFCRLREEMFKSNTIICWVIWIFILATQVAMYAPSWSLVPVAVTSTLVLTLALGLVLAEEISSVPDILRHLSRVMVHSRLRRTLFILAFVSVICIASTVPIVINRTKDDNSTCHNVAVLTVTERPDRLELEPRVPEILAIVQPPISDMTIFWDTGMRRKRQQAPVATGGGAAPVTTMPPSDKHVTLIDRILGRGAEGGGGGKGIEGSDGSGGDGGVSLVDKLLGRGSQSSTQSPMSTQAPPCRPVTLSDLFPLECQKPNFVVFTWVLCLVALATTLKMYFLVKVALAGLMVACYTTIIFKNKVFSASGLLQNMPTLVVVSTFLVLVGYHARLVEVTSRLDYLWKQEAQRELAEMTDTRKNNRQLLRNILPDHVARRFLDDSMSDELYSQSRDKVAVMFASIPNFTEFYSEDVNRGIECIRLLNEIIVDFDELISESRFSSIEKIKTVGACYMAAAGLNPTNDNEEESDLVSTLVEFAIAMKQALDNNNRHSFNNFRLRVGISSGPLVGGVIGARKPVYDIWGNTVNEASRMDSTGMLGRIQVPHHTAMLLESRGYQLERRGLVEVKGKGQMETYFVRERGGMGEEAPSRPPSQHASLATVVYSMVQARRRHHTTIRRTNPAARMVNFSSFRTTRPVDDSPLRRHTTRAGRSALRVDDAPSLRQLSAPDTRQTSPAGAPAGRSLSMHFPDSPS